MVFASSSKKENSANLTFTLFRTATTTSSSNMQPRKGELALLQFLMYIIHLPSSTLHQVLFGRHGLPLFPLLHVRLLPWHLWRRWVFVSVLLLIIPRRHSEAFPLHGDPEAHVPLEEQGRQQGPTGLTFDVVVTMVVVQVPAMPLAYYNRQGKLTR